MQLFCEIEELFTEMTWRRGVNWQHDSVDDDPWWRSGDPWQHPQKASQQKQPQQHEYIARVLDPAALSPVAQACYAAMLGLAHGSATRQVVAAACAAMIRTAKTDESDTEVCDTLHAQEQLLAIVELELGPGHGIGDVRRILKSNGYSDLASQASQLHGKRRSAAHPASMVLERLKVALSKCNSQTTCEANCDVQEVVCKPSVSAAGLDAPIADASSTAQNVGLQLDDLGTCFEQLLESSNDQMTSMIKERVLAMGEQFKGDMTRKQTQFDERFALLEKMASEAAQSVQEGRKTKQVQFEETVEHRLLPEVDENTCSSCDEEEEWDEELQELHDDPDYLEFLASGGKHEMSSDLDLEGYE